MTVARFYDKAVFLDSPAAERLYETVKDLPIVDYHCHLDPAAIAADAPVEDIGVLCLSGDHYKWRGMRMCGVDERYITGDAAPREKFFKYAEILPRLAGNPLYAWTHMELSRIFDIHEPLNAGSAARIYDAANEKLRGMTVRRLMRSFGVAFVATTDDPADDLHCHGVYEGMRVTPTFRPDRLYGLDEAYLQKLSVAAKTPIETLDDLLAVLDARLDHFTAHGCRMADHGFETFPARYATKAEAYNIFAYRKTANGNDKDAFFGFLLTWLAAAYQKRRITMQLHFGVTRNINPQTAEAIGPDSGFDTPADPVATKSLIGFLRQLPDEKRPDILLYPLNDNNLRALAAVTGAFRRVRMGAAWWFNDTADGIRRHIAVMAEYAALGTSTGMLTDSRSFASYPRFDFYRRLLCSYLGDQIERGLYDENAAAALTRDICYGNAAAMVGL